MGWYKEIDKGLTPCVEVLQLFFKGHYSNLEIEANVSELISSGVIKQHSFHSYLNLTEKFKSRKAYKLLKDSMEE